MKKSGKLSLIIVAAIAVFMTTSCKKAKDAIQNVEDNLGIPSMTCQIAGNEWNAVTPIGKIEDGNGKLIIASTAGLKSDVPGEVAVTINNTALGTYKLSALGLEANCLVVYRKSENALDDSKDYYASVDATVTITKSADGKVSGTFSATTVSATNPLDIIAITNGTFDNVKY